MSQIWLVVRVATSTIKWGKRKEDRGSGEEVEKRGVGVSL